MNVNDLKLKKIISKYIVVLGVVMIISGLILITSSGDHCGTDGGGISRASTSRGIEYEDPRDDYYTTDDYIIDSADYTGLAANAACDTYSLIKTCFALLFIFAGIFIDLKEVGNLLPYIQKADESKTNDVVPSEPFENEDLK